MFSNSTDDSKWIALIHMMSGMTPSQKAAVTAFFSPNQANKNRNMLWISLLQEIQTMTPDQSAAVTALISPVSTPSPLQPTLSASTTPVSAPTQTPSIQGTFANPILGQLGSPIPVLAQARTPTDVVSLVPAPAPVLPHASSSIVDLTHMGATIKPKKPKQSYKGASAFERPYDFQADIATRSIFTNADMSGCPWPTARPVDMTAEGLLLYATHILGVIPSPETLQALDTLSGDNRLPMAEAIEWAENYLQLRVTSITTSLPDVLRGTIDGDLPTGETKATALKLIRLVIGRTAADPKDTSKSLWFLVVPTTPSDSLGPGCILPCKYGYPYRFGKQLVLDLNEDKRAAWGAKLTNYLHPASHGFSRSLELAEAYCVTIGDDPKELPDTSELEENPEPDEKPPVKPKHKKKKATTKKAKPLPKRIFSRKNRGKPKTYKSP